MKFPPIPSPCEICGQVVPDYVAEICCSGLSEQCGCMGQPIDPCLCSPECGRAMFGSGGNYFSGTFEDRRVAAGIPDRTGWIIPASFGP